MLRRRERLQRIVLVPVRPFQRITWSLGVVLLIAMAGGLGFWLGHREATVVVVPASGAAPAQQMAVARADIQSRECAIVAQASQSLQVDNRELLASLAAIEERLLFYRRMAAPGAAEAGVIEQLELLPGQQPGTVHYRLLLASDAGAGGPTEVTLTASGTGAPQVLRLSAPRFQFRYYRQYSGDWVLPAGFAPTRVDVQLRQGGQLVTRRYKWELKS